MLLERIEIANFRRYGETDLSFSKILTILAGANNSGKTSLIQLLDCIFKGNSKLDFYDISIIKQSDIINRLIDIFVANFSTQLPLNHIDLSEKLLKLFFTVDTGELSFVEEHIDIKISVTYNEHESISLYSPYLMDLDINNRMFYFSIKQD